MFSLVQCGQIDSSNVEISFLRVGGGKDKGTRFLSFVDAIHGFRHLLLQEDLDRALSMCTGLKGQIRNKFICLSDDRVLPPYQGNKAKRAHPGDDIAFSGKRQFQDPGQNLIPSNQNPAPSNWKQYKESSVPLYHRQDHGQQLIPSVSSFPVSQAPLIQHYLPPLRGVAPLQLFQTAPPTGQPLAHVNQFPLLPQSTAQSIAQIGQPLPQATLGSAQAISQIGQLQLPPQASLGAAQSVVQVSQFPPLPQAALTVARGARSRSKKPAAGKSANSKSGTPARTTPSRAVKGKALASSKSAPMDVTSPAENYESCSDGGSVEDDQDVVENKVQEGQEY